MTETALFVFSVGALIGATIVGLTAIFAGSDFSSDRLRSVEHKLWLASYSFMALALLAMLIGILLLVLAK